MIEKHRIGNDILTNINKYTGKQYNGFIIQNDIIYLKGVANNEKKTQ